jgi:hypothetical protein
VASEESGGLAGIEGDATRSKIARSRNAERRIFT